LALFVLGSSFAFEVVDPARMVECVEKAFERSRRLAHAHGAITLVKIVGHARCPDLARPDGAHFISGNLFCGFRHDVRGAFVARARRELYS
jgi:hypothetical protein